MTDLWYGGDHNDGTDHLGSHGWSVAVSRAAELLLPMAFRSRLGYVTAARI
jgi:hypothetical protein